MRILAFGEDLCNKLEKKAGIPGMIVCLANLKRLDYSEQSGVSFRIENEEQVLGLGKSEELGICKGVEQAKSAGIPMKLVGMKP